VLVYKVYADGVPMNWCRVDIVGTPLAALTRILTTGDQRRYSTGCAGGERQVPVAAVAPSMLFSEMEVQKRAHEHERPPLLPHRDLKMLALLKRRKRNGVKAMKLYSVPSALLRTHN